MCALQDIFVAACGPSYSNGVPTSGGKPITAGQPFAAGTIANNVFVQPFDPHPAVEIYG